MPASHDGTLLTVPRGMGVRDVAAVLNAYLMAPGPQASRDDPVPERDGRFQLDSANNFWLREAPEGKALLTCRYPGQKDTVAAMAALLDARFGRKDEANGRGVFDLADLPPYVRDIVAAAQAVDRDNLDSVEVHPCDRNDDRVRRQQLFESRARLSSALAVAGLTQTAGPDQ